MVTLSGAEYIFMPGDSVSEDAEDTEKQYTYILGEIYWRDLFQYNIVILYCQ